MGRYKIGGGRSAGAEGVGVCAVGGGRAAGAEPMGRYTTGAGWFAGAGIGGVRTIGAGCFAGAGSVGVCGGRAAGAEPMGLYTTGAGAGDGAGAGAAPWARARPPVGNSARLTTARTTFRRNGGRLLLLMRVSIPRTRRIRIRRDLDQDHAIWIQLGLVAASMRLFLTAGRLWLTVLTGHVVRDHSASLGTAA